VLAQQWASGYGNHVGPEFHSSAGSRTLPIGWILGGFMAFCLLLFLAIVVPKSGGRGSRSEPPALPRADYTLTAQRLFEAFERNPERADRTYGGKLLELSGRIVSRGQDQRGRFVTFEVHPKTPPPAFENIEDTWTRIAAAAVNAFTVRCYLDAESSDIQEGQSIALRGHCEGKPQDVVLSGCRVIRGR
jgi:hypothetical protein